MNSVSRETFDSMDVNSKLGTLYDGVSEIRETLDTRCQGRSRRCEARLRRLEKRRAVEAALTSAGGALGGAAAVWAWLRWFFKGAA